MNATLLKAVLLVACACGFSPPALAQSFNYQYAGYWEHGPGQCQPAREYPDLRIRQREIDNIGSTNAYVVCSLRPPINSSVVGAHIYFSNNRSSGNLTIVCNVQDTWYLAAPKATVRQTLTLAPQERLPIAFYQGSAIDELHQSQLQAASTHCVLPPGASINIVSVQYDYEIILDN